MSTLKNLLFAFGLSKLKLLNPIRRYDVRILSKWIKEIADRKSLGSLLDIGCGDGFWTNILGKHCSKQVGIDISLSELYIAIRNKSLKSRSKFLCASGDKLPFKQSSFDIVLGLSSFQFVTDNDALFKEITRVIKDKGFLIFCVDSFSGPNFNQSLITKHRRREGVVHYYKVEFLKFKLKKYGFRVLKHKYVLGSSFGAFLVRISIFFGRSKIIDFPILYPLILISERLTKSNEYGHKLFVKAQKQC